jgi:hypothetical protein
MKLLSSRHAATGSRRFVQKTKRLAREPKEPPSTTVVVQAKLSLKVATTATVADIKHPLSVPLKSSVPGSPR